MRKGVSECSHLDCCNVIVMIKIFLQDGSIPGDRISYKRSSSFLNVILSVETSAFAFSMSLMYLLLFKHFSRVLTASMNETSSFLLVGIVTAYIFINNFKNLRKII